jgi:hypothetical protein
VGVREQKIVEHNCIRPWADVDENQDPVIFGVDPITKFNRNPPTSIADETRKLTTTRPDAELL